MTIYKNGIDFEEAYLTKDGKYQIFGLTKRANAKVGDTLYFDLCIFIDSYTYIRGVVTKVLKYCIFLDFEYVEL